MSSPVYKGRIAVHRELLKIEGNAVEMKVRLNPRAKRLIIKVHPASGEVSVVAPSRRAMNGAVEFARDQRDWIAQQLAGLPTRVPLMIGAQIPLRGQPYRIVASDNKRSAVVVDEALGEIIVGGAPEHTPRRIVDFLKKTARHDFETSVCRFAAMLDVHPKRIAMHDTRSRWGSCSTTRSLSFSWRLILAPASVLTYVAAHEVAHLREMNHSPAFWALVRQMVGDVDTPQEWLRQHGMELHRYAV